MAVFRELVIFVPQKQSFLYIMEVRVINKSHHPLPQYATSDSAGMDLRANLDSPIVLKPLERCLVPTGLISLCRTGRRHKSARGADWP